MIRPIVGIAIGACIESDAWFMEERAPATRQSNRNRRRRFGPRLAISITVALAAGAVPTLGAAQEPDETDTSPTADRALRQAIEKHEAELAVREVWLASDEARAQRANSEVAHAGLSSGEAQGLLVRKFGSVIAGLGDGPAVPENRIDGFLDDHTVRLAPPGAPDVLAVGSPAEAERLLDQAGSVDDLKTDSRAGEQLVVSDYPLRAPSDSGKNELVDLGLDRHGESLEPENPLVDVTLPISRKPDYSAHPCRGA